MSEQTAGTAAPKDAALRVAAALAAVLAAAGLACGGREGPAPPRSASPPPARAAEPARDVFVEVAGKAGIDFTHVHGGSGRKYMVETMGSGGGFLDYDNDGWLDILLLQGAPLPGHPDPKPLASRLFRNNRDGTFADVTAGSGLATGGYGQGACFGDVDNDGFLDVYVTRFGPNSLYRNDGDGTFTEVTGKAGAAVGGWSTSCAFADYDRDGFLDLYVVRYVDFTLERNIFCGTPDLQVYCHPDVYGGVPDVLLHNNGDGTFRDVSSESGVRKEDKGEDKGLGVVWTDYDLDGYPDIYVANDSTRNFLYRNNRDGTFTDVAVEAGCAFNEAGKTEAGMGVAAGDVDRNGSFDLFITHLDFETNTLYRNNGDGTFDDRSAPSGLGPPSLLMVGFGTGFFDVDEDGDLDVYVANGHILDNIERKSSTVTYAQRPHLFTNRGDGRFTDVSATSGAFFQTAWVGRGAAFADYDNDGDVDILQTNCGQRALLLRNESDHRNAWIDLRLVSRFGGRDAVGALVKLVAGDLTQVEEVRAGNSYLSQGDLRLHFGLGGHRSVERLEIRWPEGGTLVVPGDRLRIGQLNTIRQER